MSWDDMFSATDTLNPNAPTALVHACTPLALPMCGPPPSTAELANARWRLLRVLIKQKVGVDEVVLRLVRNVKRPDPIDACAMVVAINEAMDEEGEA